MNIALLIAPALLATCLVSGAAHAALEGRDLDGNWATSEAYYDTVLDITWLANANYGAGSSYDNIGIGAGTTTDGKMTWLNANAWAADLSFTDGTNVYDDWRLPTVEPVNGVSFNYGYSFDGTTDIGYNITSPNNEMAYMYYVNFGNSGFFTPTGALADCWGKQYCLDNAGLFSNLKPFYWSATQLLGEEFGPPGDRAWYFYMYDGSQSDAYIYGTAYAWAVSPGDIGLVAAVPEADTWAMLLAGLGLVGIRLQSRKAAQL